MESGTKASKKAALKGRPGEQPFLLKYKGFAESLNAMFNAASIGATAYALNQFEAKSGRKYEFGGWAPTLAAKLGDEGWGGKDAREAWASSVADIPPVIRKQMGHLIRDNVLDTPPVPIIFDVKLGPDHGIEVGYGIDKSTGVDVEAVTIAIVCKK